MTPNKCIYGVFRALILLAIVERRARLMTTLRVRLALDGYDRCTRHLAVVHDDHHLMYKLWYAD